MSKQAVLAFRERVAQGADLQQAIRGQRDRGQFQLSGIVDLGKREGFDFTIEEVNQVFADPGDNSLSDFELEMVSGGARFSCEDT